MEWDSGFIAFETEFLIRESNFEIFENYELNPLKKCKYKIYNINQYK